MKEAIKKILEEQEDPELGASGWLDIKAERITALIEPPPDSSRLLTEEAIRKAYSDRSDRSVLGGYKSIAQAQDAKTASLVRAEWCKWFMKSNVKTMVLSADQVPDVVKEIRADERADIKRRDQEKFEAFLKEVKDD